MRPIISATSLRRAFKPLTATALFFLLAPSVQAQSPSPLSVAKKEELPAKTIEFKNNISLGQLFITDRMTNEGFLMDSNNVVGGGKYIGLARGKINRPAGYFLYLLPSYDVLQSPKLFETIPPDALDCVAFGNTLLMTPVDAIVAPLSHLTGLKRLEINAGEMDDSQLLQLKTLVNLQCLSACGNSITGSGLQALKGMTKLRWIDLSLNKLSSEAYTHLAACKSLEDVHLSHCQVDDEAIKLLATLPHLRMIEIGQPAITSKSLLLLKKVESLTNIKMIGTRFTARELLLLRGSHLKHLTLSTDMINMSEKAMVAKALAPTNVLFVDHTKGNVSKDTKTMFAPLH